MQVKVDIPSLELVCQTYAPPDHPVFLLLTNLSTEYVSTSFRFYDIPCISFTDLIAIPFTITHRQHTIATLAVDTNARSMIGMAGSFKTCHPAMVSVTGTSSSPPLSILSAMQLVAKRVFFQDNQVKGCHQFGREDELSKTLDEVNCLYWGGSLVGMAYMFVDEMLKTGKVSQDVVDLIPRLRVVHAALAIPDDPDDSLDAIYLVEEKIHGRFIKYINNNSTVPADSLQGREVVIGLFLCFVQHVQYQLTNSMVYLSDFQGNSYYCHWGEGC